MKKTTSVLMKMAIEEIILKEKYRLRSSEGSGAHVEETAEEYSKKFDELPPVTVMKSSNPALDNHLLSGFTRLAAAKKAGLTEIDVEILECDDEKQALRQAAESNMKHGLRLQKKDRELIARTLETEGFSRREIAQIFHYSAASITQLLGKKAGKVRDEERQRILNDMTISAKEAAKQLGITDAAVYGARKKLKEKLAQAKGTSDSEANPTAPQVSESQTEGAVAPITEDSSEALEAVAEVQEALGSEVEMEEPCSSDESEVRHAELSDLEPDPFILEEVSEPVTWDSISRMASQLTSACRGLASACPDLDDTRLGLLRSLEASAHRFAEFSPVADKEPTHDSDPNIPVLEGHTSEAHTEGTCSA